jgi:hypothetical protein
MERKTGRLTLGISDAIPAVFCGFLAENFREHQVEHQREKQYIISMLRELEADTAQLKIVLKIR